jgi:hypothetical protein
VNAALRARAAADWAQVAQLEHASIASFARFTLQLLAVGAPPQLVEASLRAGLDEVAHARATFRLASRYAGAPVGPGPLPLHGPVLGDLSLATIAAATVTEGCVNETIGALEAAEAAAGCEDAEVRDVLNRIAEEEARHGELAWAFVRWALGVGGDDVRRAVGAAFEIAEAALQVPPPASDPDAVELRRQGLLTARERHEIRLRGLREIVRPAAAQLEFGPGA